MAMHHHEPTLKDEIPPKNPVQGLLHDVDATPKHSVAVLASTISSDLRARFGHSELGHEGTAELLQCLLTRADEAHKRYCKDWKLADANERVRLLKSAFELAKGVPLDFPPSADISLPQGNTRGEFTVTQETQPRVAEGTTPCEHGGGTACFDPAYQSSGLLAQFADSKCAVILPSTILRSSAKAQFTSACLALGCALSERFQHLGQEKDLDEQLSAHQLLLRLLPKTDVVYPKALRYVGSGLRARFELRGDHRDIEEALSAHRQALSFHPLGHADRHYSLRELGASLDALYRHSGDRDGLDDSISYHRAALDLRTQRNMGRCESLRDVARGIYLQYMRVGGGELLEEAMSLIHQALEIHLPHHPSRHTYLNDLGLYNWTLFNKDGNVDDLDQAVICHSAALQHRRELDHPSVFKSLSNLALAFGDRYTKTADPGDELQALVMQREALALCPLDFPSRETALNNLAMALFRRGKRLANMAELEESISIHREALRLRPKEHRFHALSLSNLSAALSVKYRFDGDVENLEEAILLSRTAVELLPHGSPLRNTALLNLQTALLNRFGHFANIEDINECITVLQGELDICRSEYPGNLPQTLSSLADVFKAKYAQAETIADLEAAIGIFRKWSNISEIDPIRRMNGHYEFARTLFLRFQALGALADVDEAILHFEEAIRCSGSNGQLRPCILSALAVALGCRYDRTGSLDDCEAAMKHQREAMDVMSAVRQCRSHALCALSRLHLLREAPYFDLAAAIRCIQEAARLPNTSAHTRLTDALDVLHALEDIPLQHVKHIVTSAESVGAEIIAAYRSLVDLLPRISYLGSVTAVRLKALHKAEPLALSGATYALTFGQPEAALEILEEGRAVFWSQALRLRHPLSDVPQHLACELAATARQLEGNSGASSGLSHASQTGTEEDTTRLRRLSDHFESLLQDVRATPGLDRFLLPPSIELLRVAAFKGPIVVLLASKLSCDALILTQMSALKHIPLPSITQARLDRLGELLQASNLDQRLALDESRRGIRRSLPKSKGADYILAELWEMVMRPIVEGLEVKLISLDDRPRIWLCPTGSFTRLPVHAAQSGQLSCSDFFVASYTPTVHNLLLSRRQFCPVRRNDVKVLLAAVPQPKSWHPLHFVQAEVDAILNTLPSSATVTYATDVDNHLDTDRGATVAGVLDQIHDNSIVHLACHGRQDPTQPLESGFIMEDGVLTVARLMSLNLPKAFMAFLSACETAKGDQQQPDQAIHLSAALMFTGFKSMVGTLWSMQDAHGPLVAEKVYSALFKGEGTYLDPDVIPRALDEATRELRSRKLHPSVWATYVHMGI